MIAPSVEPLIAKQLSSYGIGGGAPHYEELLEDPIDEYLFVNYLGVGLGHFPDYLIHRKLLPAHRERVLNGLRDHKSDPHVRSKYEWLAGYHNYVCRRFAELHDLQGDEGADPEQQCHGAEAQRALDYLVPVEGVQSPRPLDAKRLRRRLSSPPEGEHPLPLV